MDIDAGPRYDLLKQALQKDYAKSKNQHYEILITRNKTGRITNVIFKYDNEIITEYESDTGVINDFGAYSEYYSHLDHNKVMNVLRNAAAIEMALQDGILTGDAPIRAFERFVRPEPPDANGWTVVEEPTKVKHKNANDGKPIIAIPVRRTDASRAKIDTDSWVVYAFKEIDAPDTPKRSGGYGRGNTNPGS